MPKLVHQETICCGHKRCPTVKVFSDGSFEISDDDTEAGSVGAIKVRAEAVSRIVELISKKQEK